MYPLPLPLFGFLNTPLDIPAVATPLKVGPISCPHMSFHVYADETGSKVKMAIQLSSPVAAGHCQRWGRSRSLSAERRRSTEETRAVVVG